KLHAGNNTVSFYASYGSGDDEVTSTTVNTTVVAGTVSFGHISGGLVFTPTDLTGNGNVTICPNSKWYLYVDDTQTRVTPCKVAAQMTGMYLSITEQTAVPTPLNGSLVYKDPDTGNETTLGDAATVVKTGTSTSADGSSTNIAEDWGDD